MDKGHSLGWEPPSPSHSCKYSLGQRYTNFCLNDKLENIIEKVAYRNSMKQFNKAYEDTEP